MKNLLGLYILLLSNLIWSQNTFEISSETVDVNTEFSLSVDLDNSVAITAFQFDLSYNETALELSTGHSLTSRAENHSITASNIGNNTIRVIVYSSNNEVVDIGTGAILNLNFTSKNLPGTYNINISNIVLSDVSGQELESSSINGSVTVIGPIYSLNQTSIDFGEVPIGNSPTQNVSISNNGNTDLVISSYSINSPFSISTSFPITISAGSTANLTINIDSSTKQNITENLTFTTNDTDPLRSIQFTSVQANIYAVNEIYIGTGQGETNTEITIPVSISNMESFSGFQFDITLPNDINYVANSLVLSSRSSDHLIQANIIGGNTLRFISYSNSNADFSGNQGEVFSFKLQADVSSGTYPLNISNSIVSNLTLGNIVSDVYNGSITVNAPYLTTTPQSIDYGNFPFTETRSTEITLYNSGTAELIIDEVIKNNDIFSFPISLPLSIAVGQSETITLTFTPSSSASHNEDISIRHNGPTEQNIINVLANTFSPNYLKILDSSICADQSVNIDLNLFNNDAVRAMQFDINFPNGFVLDNSNVTGSSLLDDFTISSSSIGGNSYRFVVYSVSNSNIQAGDNTVLSLPISVESSVNSGSYNFTISNVTLSDINNQNIASQVEETGTIIIIELTTTVVSLAGDNPITMEVGSTFTDPGATAANSCDNNISVAVSSTVDTSVVGSYTVTYTATYSSDNTTTATRTVNVVDTTAPVITITGDNPVTIELGATYTDAGATVTDNYDTDISVTVSSTVDTSVVGSYTVTYTAEDASGNEATAVVRTVNVVDTTAPVITITGDNPVTIELGATYTDEGATATDLSGDITVTTTSTVDTDNVGSYTVTYTAADASGNSATAVVRTVNVVDTTAPVITITGDNPTTIELGATYTDEGATATDLSGDITVTTTSTVDTDDVGSYTVTYTATDSSGNSATAVVRTVNVVDTTAPVITITGDNPVTVELGATYTDQGATATDLSGDITVTSTSTVDTDNVGSYTVTYTAEDASGNEATTVTRTVNVVDTTAPVITITGDNPTTIELGATYTDEGATATDLSGDITVTTTSTVDTDDVGSYTVTYTATDSSGNSATAVVRTVNVVDTTAPVITITGDNPVTVELGATYTDQGATATDLSGDITVTSTSTVDTDNVGSYTVTYTAADASGNSATAVVRTVNVVDTTAPVITITGDNPTTIELGATYTDEGATATDLSGDITVTTTSTVDTDDVGSYTVTYTATDSSGNSATAVVRTVNVVDTTAPVITITGDNPVTVELGATYTDQGATATDLSGDITVTSTSTVDTDNVGSYTVTYTAEDASGNEATTVTRTVNVVDTTAPVITITGDNPTTIELGATYTDEGATATDLSGDITVTTTSTVDTDDVGSYTVTYTATDSSGNSATAVVRTVNVVDTTAPVITITGDNPVTVELGATYTDQGATATDLSGDITVTSTSTVDTDNVGSYTVTYTAEDASGNEATTVTRTVNVVDTTAPVITITGDNPTTIELGATYTDEGATATDLSGDITVTTTSTVDTDDVGSYTVTYTATDSSGNSATAVVRTVNVVDTTAPVITITGDNPVTVELGATYTDQGATATDLSGDITVTSTSTVDTDNVGSYTVTYTAEDASGNEATTVTRTVNVVDTTAPVITLVGDNPMNIEVGDTFTDPGATALDIIGGEINVTTTGSVDSDTIGVYTLTYTATDSSGNTTTTTRTVNVVDTIAPTITLVGDNPITIEVGDTYTDAGATATDNYDTEISVTTTGFVDSDTIGVYTLTYTATDSSGNTTTATRTVNVVDTTAPVITLNGDNPTTIEVGTTFTDPGASATDNYDTEISVTVSGEVNSENLGSYTLTYTVTDSSGNTTTTTRTVNVVDTTAPIITLIGDNPITIEVGDTFTDTGATATDNYDTEISVTTTGFVDSDTIGVYTLTYTATDSSGNTTTTTRTVNVVDTTAPVITIAGDNPMNIEVGGTFTDPGASATDNYDTEISVSVTGTVDTSVVVVYTITYTAIDSSGNTTTATRIVNIFSPNYLKILDSLICADLEVNNISLNLFSNDAVRAIQFDINFPVGFVLDNSNVTGTALLDDFTITSSLIGDNTYRFLVYTISNSSIQAGDNTILNLPISVDSSVDSGSYNLTISNVTLSNINNQNIASEALEIGTITVFEDCTAPVITIIGDNPTTIEVGTSFNDPGATALDITDGEINVTTTGIVDTSVIGVYTITYTATDSSDNTTTATRIVNVVDTTAPVITLIGDNLINIEVGGTFTDPGASATDNYDSEISVTVSGTVDNNTVGVYILTYSAIDSSGNTTNVNRTVNVLDTTAPVITLIGDNPMNIEVGGTFTDPGASATDNYDSEISVTVSGTVDINTVGIYTLTYTATDSSGNTTTATRIVNIFDDNIPPTALCQDISVILNENQITITASQIDNNSTDEFGIASLSINIDSFDCSNLGENTVILTVTDVNGNSSECSATVTVIDDTNPTIIAPEDILSFVNEDSCYTTELALGNPEVEDNCIISSITNDAPDTFNTGETIITWTVTDSVGNSSTDTQIITIQDNIPPVITETFGDFAINCQVNNVNIGTPQVSDNCGVSSLTNNAPDEFIVGQNFITWIATDNNGNTAEYLQTITLTNTQTPTAICNDITLTLEEGIVIISAEDINGGSFDECGEVTISVSQTDFDESHIGDNTVILTVTDSGGNTDTCEAIVTVEPGLSIEENILENINIYPNPTANVLYIKSNYSLDYDMFNIVGQKIISGQINEGDNELNLRQYSNGIYFIKFIKNNRVYTKKIIKN